MKFAPIILSALMTGTGFGQELSVEKTAISARLPEFLRVFDVNDDGVIDEEERQAIRDYRHQLREERRVSIDLDDDGEISIEEVAIARESIRESIATRRLERFSQIAGEDALLTFEELLIIPGISDLPPVTIEAIFARLDADESGAVDVDEFYQRLRAHHSTDEAQ